jgi:glycosyltransferase involved in cell wall biosynthesis
VVKPRTQDPTAGGAPIHLAIITAGYLPLRHVSATRPSNLARELARRGHQVTVLTIDWRAPGVPPEALSVWTGEPPSRAATPENPDVIAIDPRAWFPDFRPERLPLTTEPPPPASPLRRRLVTLRRTLGFGPFESWGRAGLRALIAHHARHKVDVVFAIHGDASTHEIAHRFSRRAKVPWVADFKDPWDLFHQGSLRWAQWLATARRLRSAAVLTETCAAQGTADAARFRRPAHVLWSGYDADTMAKAEPERLSAGFALAYLGNLGPQHDIDAIGRLLDAWQKAPCPPYDAPLDIELHVFSNDTGRLRDLLKARGVERLLTLHAFVPREKAYGIMKGAGALLLLPATHFVPSGGSIGVKELEYLASGTPVLSLGRLLPELSEVARGCPQLLEAASAGEGAAFLRKEAQALRDGQASPRRAGVNLPSVHRHAWPEKAADLERILDRVIATG